VRAERGGIGGPALERGLAELGCPALLVLARSSRDPDLAPWVGPVHLGPCFLLAVAGAPARLAYLAPIEREEAGATGLPLLTPEELEIQRRARDLPTEEAWLAATVEKALAATGVPPGRLALAGQGPAGTVHAVARALEQKGWTLVAANRLSRLLRKPKGALERQAAARAAAGAATALRRVAELLAAAGDREGELWLAGERLTAGRLRREVALCLAGLELEQPEGNILAAGREAAVPHSAGRPERVLRPGESIVVDLFPRGFLFADVTRTLCVGAVPEALAAGHEAVEAALSRAYGKLVPEAVQAGLRAYSVQDSVASLFRARGYPTVVNDPGTTSGYVHNLGHGVGFELHEYPSFRREAGEEGVLAPGDLLTLEPGLYDPEAGWGVRLEDLVFLGSEGPENLTPLPYDLDPRAWG
jgi:Xaa-Pro aminopeptidase